MIRSIIAGLVLVILAIVALRVLIEREPELPPVALHEAFSGSGSGRHGDAADAIPASRPAAGATPIATKRFVEDESAPPLPGDDDALRVLVVDEATDRPVPGAEVAWFVDPPGTAESSGHVVPVLAAFDAAPNRTTTNSRGLALVRTAASLSVAARHGRSFGLREFQTAPEGEIRLPIGVGTLIAARVEDETGAPVPGVEVAFSITRRTATVPTVTRLTARSRTPDGLAIADHSAAGRSSYEGNVEVAAHLYHPSSVIGAKASMAALANGPIRLVVPRSGRVAVRLLDPTGAPIAGAARVELRSTDAPLHRSVPMVLWARAEAGVALFAGVPAGPLLVANAYGEDFDSILGREIGRVAAPGDLLTCDLAFERRRGPVTGRAVDEDGNPLALRDLRIDVSNPDWTTAVDGKLRTRTDDSGKFELTLDRGQTNSATLTLDIEAGSDRVEGSAMVTVRNLDADGVTSLGDVRFTRPSVLAAGIVTDENGLPLEHALVAVSRFHSGRMDPHRSGRRQGGPGFDVVNPLRGRSDASGRFAIQRSASQVLIGFVDLAAELAGYVCREPPINVRPGKEDLKIVLHGTGAIEGVMLLPESAPVTRIQIHVESVASPSGETEGSIFRDSVDSDGRFRVAGILPGIVSVAIRTRDGQELVAITGVVVPRLGTADDARLRSIDLRGHPAVR